MAWYDVIYNTEIAGLEEDFTSAYEDYLELLDEQEQNYPTLKKMMQEAGTMGVGGKIDYSQLLDTEAAEQIEERGKESEVLDLATLKQSAAQSAALAGTGGGISATNSLAELLNEVSRGASMDYADAYSDLATQAKSEAYEQGLQDQQDTLEQFAAERDAAAGDVDYAQLLMEKATPGLVQTEEGWQAIGTVGGAIAGGIIGGPAGGSVGGTVGGTIGSVIGGLFEKDDSELPEWEGGSEWGSGPDTEGMQMAYSRYLQSGGESTGMNFDEWLSYGQQTGQFL